MYKSLYTEGVANSCPHDLPTSAAAPDAVMLYQQILSQQPDNSVTIVTTGDMTNLAKLLQMPAENNFPSGMDLVKKKVKLWVCMGGNFIGRPAKDDLAR
ncbi:MAG TPA: hypothetical protein VHV83_05445 [Armatimonadota bacterium]|nr:hypothetical protein [Armatimonadota bacterium]